ncbi:MAG: diacylglycerol kinase family protein [Candidatus Gracilibacteria bacterium]|jgi:diacylglycerol kinase family enzyme
MKKALVIFNPVSGHKKWGDTSALFQGILEKHGYDYTWYETRPNQDLLPLFKNPYDRVVVSGGDGTVAEVVRAMMETKAEMPLVVVPQGSGNLLALSLGIPLLQPGRALKMGLTGKPRSLDIMRINRTHYGTIAVGRGYDAFLMQETPRELKRKLGLLAYAWVFLKTALFYRPEPYKLTIDGQRSAVFARSIMVFNAFPFPLVPIRPDDGVLNILVLTSKGLLQHHKGKTISIKSPKEFKFQLDGEVLKGKVVTVETLPAALKIICKK